MFIILKPKVSELISISNIDKIPSPTFSVFNYVSLGKMGMSITYSFFTRKGPVDNFNEMISLTIVS